MFRERESEAIDYLFLFWERLKMHGTVEDWLIDVPNDYFFTKTKKTNFNSLDIEEDEWEAKNGLKI